MAIPHFYEYRYITQYVAYNDSFTKGIKQRIDNDSCFNIIDSIESFLKNHLDKLPDKYCSLENKKRLISSLFILSIVLSGYQTTEERTELLELFFADKNRPKGIKSLYLMNLHSSDNSDNKKILFNFGGFKFDDCEFANYEYFAHCKFDNDTYFTNTRFIAPLRSHGITCNVRKEHIDTTSCMSEGIIDIINENQKVNDEKDSSLRNEVKIIIRYFWVGSSFRKKLANGVNKKLQKYHTLIKKLKKLNVIKVETTTTKEKRADDQYYISSEYSDLRKIMEENETCPEFEKIITMLKDNS